MLIRYARAKDDAGRQYAAGLFAAWWTDNQTLGAMLSLFNFKLSMFSLVGFISIVHSSVRQSNAPVELPGNRCRKKAGIEYTRAH
jgi:hypothetical protein